MALPFDVNSSTNRKIILLVQYVWITLYDTTLFGNIMSLVLTLVIHLGGQLDIISHAIENISTLSEKSESVGLKIRSLISKHQRIISMSDDIEALFTYVLLVHFLFNILIICSVGFAIAAALRTNQGTVVVVKLIAYYCVLIMEAFIYCYAGEYLNNKSSGFGDTAYKSEWYNLKAKESRMLVLLVLRSQKSLCLTIGKFMDLSFARFTSIMKLSVSYISVLLAVY
ncbi:odorant receptor 85b-like [Prorops nasuta]|uniref:odorant receptor 85b-like n=1 Tax=Prorops nasuta TaxID=863751 RepID=UPI0034CEFBA0